MHFAVPALLGLAAAVSAAPTPSQFPGFTDGFPSPNPQQLLAIEQIAGGTTSNAPPPANVTPDTLSSLQLIEIAEYMESTYFSMVKGNITDGTIEIPSGVDQTAFMAFLDRVIATEELHYLGVAGPMKHFAPGKEIASCTRFTFPAMTWDNMLNFAILITENVISTLGDVAMNMGMQGDTGLIPVITNTLSNEAQQLGYFRMLAGLDPIDVPQATTGSRYVTVAALGGIVDYSSCSNIGNPLGNDNWSNLSLMSQLLPMKNLSPITGANTTIKYQVTDNSFDATSAYWLFIVNQLNVPLVVPATVISSNSTEAIIAADFPWNDDSSTNMLNGLNILFLAKGGQVAPAPTNIQQCISTARYGPVLAVVN